MSYISFILFSLVFYLPYEQSDSTGESAFDSLLINLEAELDSINIKHQSSVFFNKAYDALAMAKSEGDPSTIAKVHKIIADGHYYSVDSNNPDSVYYHDNQILEYLKRTDQLEKIADAHDQVGKDLSSLGRFTEAEAHIFDAIKIYEELDDQKNLASSYASLNVLYRDSKDYEQALIYGEKSLVLKEQVKEEETDLIEPLLGLIKTYPKVGKADLALEKAQQVVDIIREKYGEEDNVHLANVRSWRGEVYVALGDYKKAYEDFVYSWNVIKTIVKTEEEADGWKGDIGNTLRLQGKYKQAIPLIKDAITHHHERNITNWERVENYHFWVADCYNKINQTDSSIVYLSRAQELQNDRLTEELSAVKSELRIKYDTDLKEATIEAQEDVIHQQNKVQALSYGIGLLLLTMLGGVLYTFQNNRKKNTQLQLLNKTLTQTNVELEKQNERNQLLMKEIHHRVKNNLQILSSLLSLQSDAEGNEQVIGALQEGRNRVESMGLIHQRLYAHDTLSAIDLKKYIPELCDYLTGMSNRESNEFTITHKVDVRFVDVETAIPLGLIINELITNSLKYARSETRKVEIKVELYQNKSDNLVLIVSDNGTLKSENNDFTSTNFGSKLIRILSKKLKGEINSDDLNGYSTTIVFSRFELFSDLSEITEE